ncbi:MAG: DinB family protein [Chloroflexi bacterium]|nr:DinB family protein [Chloroflexota bacterium]
MNDTLPRLRALHGLWERGVAGLTVDQVNHVERAGVLPIAFTLVHFVRGEDAHAVELLDTEGLLWDQHVTRFGYEGVIPSRGTPMADAERVRIGDMDAWRAYQRAVFAQVEQGLERLPEERLALPMFGGGRPESLRGGFLAAYVPQGTITRRHAIEAWLYQHGCRHLGELEHARALVGLGGLS